MPVALVTGVTGQDGQHLVELLNGKGYEVWGMIRGQSAQRLQVFREEFPYVNLIEGDLTDLASLVRVVTTVRPDEVYNLGALSFVGLSFQQPEATANVTGLGPLRLLEALRLTSSTHTKFYQASSSEMFGKVTEVPQSESTRFYPRSPYGVAKVFAHNSCINYRESYDMWVSCGILFNHEGPRRGEEFVTRKITRGAARIAAGLQSHITLGSLDPRRDWGYAGDYVDAMWRMLQQDEPEDYVVATGQTHSVRDFVERSVLAAGLPGPWEDYVRFDERFIRPAEVDLLVGDNSKARTELGWCPSVSFDGLVEMMVQHDLKLLAQS